MEEQSTIKSSNNSHVTVLWILLVIASFFVGNLSTKVKYLEKTGSGVAGVQTGTAGAGTSGSTIPQAGAAATAPAQPPAAAAKKPEITDADYYRGNKNAKVVFVEYSDFECPFCQRHHPTMQRIMKEYGDKVKWVYRHYPLSFHANAHKAAEASECVGKQAGQDGFWKFTDLYFERTTAGGTGFPLDKLADLGAEAGADKDAVQKCLNSSEMEQKVKNQMARGTEEGVSGTPGNIIIDGKGNTQLVPGALPFDQFKPMIEAAINS